MCPKGLVNTQWAAFGPRIGFAYDLTGSGKTVLRGGFGSMYERIQGNDMYNAGPNIPFSTSVTFSNASLDNPNINLQNGNVPSHPSRLLILPALQWTITNHRWSTSTALAFSVRSLPGLCSSLMYVGNQSRQQNYYTDVNLPDPSFLPQIYNNTINRNTVNPYLGFGSIKQSYDGANGHYNGLQVDLNSQVRRDLSLRVFYTLSRGYDSSNQTNGGGGGGDLVSVSNPYAGWRYDWGPNGYDRLHNLSANFIYDLPFLRHASNAFVRTVVGGWEVSGVVRSSPVCRSTSRLTETRAAMASAETTVPTSLAKVRYPHSQTQWFDAGTAASAVFAPPAPGAWGNLGYDALRGPGRDNWNLSLFKNFVFSEARGSQFELRLETFNTFNHTQWQNVSTGCDPGYNNSFGQVTSAFPGRIIQLGGKISF